MDFSFFSYIYIFYLSIIYFSFIYRWIFLLHFFFYIMSAFGRGNSVFVYIYLVNCTDVFAVLLLLLLLF